jgi:predicted KAP-like P-loop ATPase
MLKKLTEIEVRAESPFANDALERKQSIERLTSLVESTEQPFVLSVEAPWGWGKTTFIRMWKTHLESNGHICLHFNAWENDFVDDPLV